jgi:hypothetical protein
MTKAAGTTHTLRQEVASNPGGRFPLGIGSICKVQKTRKTIKISMTKHMT